MAETRVTRKLAAIVAADMVGYSHLIGLDEAGTITRQKAHRTELIDPKIAEYNGRIVKTTGDGLLIEFASAVDAVLCSVAIQRAMAEREADSPEDRRIAYRVGINLGEIVTDGDDILGDGVNVAARLEALAEPGGIRISDAVFQNVKGKLDLGFADLGAQKVKNIADPVSTYRVLLDPDDVGKFVPVRRIAPPRLRWATGAVALVLLFMAAGVIWWRPWVPDVEPARLARMKLPLPEKPSVAVLPFDDLSTGQGKGLLAEGITEDIITNLARVGGLFVIARNSTFTYKGKPVKVQRVSEELGVRYVVEGSVRREGNRVRITAQLIDALSGHHLWAQRYDREIGDVFRVQDEIAKAIATKLVGELNWAEGGKRFTRNLDAYHLVLRARREWTTLTPGGNKRARQLANRAIALDPNYARAHVWLAYSYINDVRFGFDTRPKKESIALAIKHVNRAVTLDPSDPYAHQALGSMFMMRGNFDRSIASFDKSIALRPNNPTAIAVSSLPLHYSGQFDKAIARVRTAMRLNPYHGFLYHVFLAQNLYMKGDFTGAVAAYENATLLNPKSALLKLGLAASYCELGRKSEALAIARPLIKANPKLGAFGKSLPYKEPSYNGRWTDCLVKAGLPGQALKANQIPPNSIVVLPFDNLSGDKAQEYLADGLSENIIHSLSKVSELFVIARNSSFTYKGKPTKVQRVAVEMGVRYVLEGSVQKSGDRIRVTAQLIDAVRGNHLWSERYDRKLTELFAVQDEITRNIVVELNVSLKEGEQARLRHSSTKNLKAWGYYVRALTLFRRGGKANNARARELTKQAIKLDPQYFAAWRGLAWTHWFDARFGWSNSRTESFKKAVVITQKALALDPNDPEIHMLLSGMYLVQRKFDRAAAAGRKSIELGPNLADAKAVYAWTLYSLGEWDEAIASFKSALRLSPRAPAWYYGVLARAYVYSGKHDLAIAMAEKALAVGSGGFIGARFHYTLAFAHVEAGRPELARKHILEAQKLYPPSSIKAARRGVIFKDPAHLERLLAALRKAGMPEN